MYFIKINEGVPQGSPISLNEIKNIFPQANTVDDVIGYAEFVFVSQPETQRFFRAVETTPTLNEDGKVYQTWSIEEFTDQEKTELTDLTSRGKRLIRQGLLLHSDWSQLPDNPLSDEQKLAYKTYRQQLRDLTNQPGFPWDVTWPTPPS